MRDFKNPEQFLAGGGRRILPYGQGRTSSSDSRRRESVRTTFHADVDAHGNPIFDTQPLPPKASAFRDERMAAQRDVEARRKAHASEHLAEPSEPVSDSRVDRDAYFAKTGRVIPVAPQFKDDNQWGQDSFTSTGYPSSKSAREKLTYTPHRIPREQKGDGHLTDRHLDWQERQSIRDLRTQRDADFDKLLDEISLEAGQQESLPDFVPQNAELVSVKGKSALESRVRHVIPENAAFTETVLEGSPAARTKGSGSSEWGRDDMSEDRIDPRDESGQWFDQYEDEMRDNGSLTRAKTISEGVKSVGEWYARRYGPTYKEIDAYGHARRATEVERYSVERELGPRLQAAELEADHLRGKIKDLRIRRDDARWYGDGKTHAETYRELPRIEQALREADGLAGKISRELYDVGDEQERGIVRAFHRRFRRPKDDAKPYKPRGDGQSPRNTPPRLFDDTDV